MRGYVPGTELQPCSSSALAIDSGLRELRTIIDNLQQVVYQIDLEGRWTFLNPAWTDITGFSVDETLEKPFLDSIHPDDREASAARFASLISGGKANLRREVRCLRKGGGFCWLEVRSRARLDAEGRVAGCSGTLTDITARRRATDELKRTAAALERREAILRAVSFSAKRFLHTPAWQSELPVALEQLCLAADAERVRLFQEFAEGDNTGNLVIEWSPRGNGSLARPVGGCEVLPVIAGSTLWGMLVFETGSGDSWPEATRTALRAAADMIGAAIHRQKSEEAAQHRDALLDAVTGSAPIGMLVLGRQDDSILYFNRRLTELWGLESVRSCMENRDLKGREIGSAMRTLVRNPDAVFAEDGGLRRNSGKVLAAELFLHDERVLHVISHKVTDRTGECFGHVFVFQDITAQKEVEQALRSARDELAERVSERTRELAQANASLKESEELYRTLVEVSPDAIVFSDLNRNIVLVNQPAAALFGFDSPAGMIGRSLFDFVPFDQRPAAHEGWNQVYRTGLARGLEIELQRANGTRFLADISGSVSAAPGSDARYMIGVIRDITPRRQLEEQFRQAQKMEAVGRLAGGVAHDFNNLLTVIKGYSELLMRRFPETEPTGKRIRQIAKAADRAATLVGQLLAFSRKQTVEPKPVDVAQALRDLEKMLRRLIGAQIDLECAPDPDAGCVLIDPGQLDQMIINLVVNSRDAIHDSGKITLATRLLRPDELPFETAASDRKPNIEVTVADTGGGISDDVKSRMFEPFFTTKEVGKGTGLGLSTVYGAVQQAGGRIRVDSAPGQGATFRIYLPVVPAVTQTARGEPSEDHDGPDVKETILVVEDEDLVRAMVVETLQEKGYAVLEARNGADALNAVADFQDHIHLVLTDVVMPGMGGLKLRERVSALRPNTRVMLMSGYSEHGIPEGAWLPKPFDAPTLISRVRQALA